jgi:hypothetical protein
LKRQPYEIDQASLSRRCTWLAAVPLRSATWLMLKVLGGLQKGGRHEKIALVLYRWT